MTMSRSWSPATAAWIAFAIAALFFLFEFVVRIEPSLATDAIERFYGLSDAGFGTVASLFFWIYAPMQIVVGLLLDRYGARRFVLLGSALCASGVLMFALTAQPWIGGAGRVLMGFGASFAFVSALWLVNHWFAPERFALLSGSVNAIGMLGTAIGGVALSGLIDHVGWRAVFIATACGGFVICLLAALFLREPASPASGPKASGAAAHVRDSLRAVFGDARTWGIAVVGLLYYMPVNVYGGLWGVTELVRDRGLTPVRAETVVSTIFWGIACGSVAGGWLSDRLGHRKYLVFAGAVLTGAAYAGALYLPALTEWQLGALLFAGGFFGGLQMLTFVMAKEGQDNRRVGTVVAFVNMIGIGGALIFQPLVGDLESLAGGDLRVALLTVPACVVLAAVIVLFVPEYRHPAHQPGAPRPARHG
ncbi:MFS transporter [Oleiagrimonas citrea]|uniref:MFS transporter n=1 Tax=Oleiagrimonas citrea TaxID=1665687 RepID=A0A846ZLX2_9GAMM|nr:MFS transporter [Oleiagrimonas citrea]NKZ38443.1 MFS transporter [Oleiagrimonas citrea]